MYRICIQCSFRNFQCKYLENNAFSKKILNTKVSQFRGGNTTILFMFYLLNIFQDYLKANFLFLNRNLYFYIKIYIDYLYRLFIYILFYEILFYERKKHFILDFILKKSILFNKIKIFFSFAIFREKNEKLSDTNETLIFK